MTNILATMLGWEQYYCLKIERPDEDPDEFDGLTSEQAVELVRLCLTIDSPHATVTISPVKPEKTH
jgi:predicted Zn-dependent peptidase